LASVVAHELGHILGYPDIDGASADLMSATLPAGVSRIGGVEQARSALSTPLLAVADWRSADRWSALTLRDTSPSRALRPSSSSSHDAALTAWAAEDGESSFVECRVSLAAPDEDEQAGALSQPLAERPAVTDEVFAAW
jgi:hypothetical protein